MTGEQRMHLADLLRTRRDDLADRATQMFYVRHPEWWERFGPRGRELTRQDSAHNIDFLAGAADAGNAESFAAYCLWSARLLESRGIALDYRAQGIPSSMSTAIYWNRRCIASGGSGNRTESA